MANMRTVNVYDVTLTVANTEYSQALPPQTSSHLRCKFPNSGGCANGICDRESGQINAPFFTLKAGGRAGDS